MKQKDRAWLTLLIQNVKLIALSAWLMYETKVLVRENFEFAEERISEESISLILAEIMICGLVFAVYFLILLWGEKKIAVRFLLSLGMLSALVVCSIYQYDIAIVGILLILYYCIDGLIYCKWREKGSSLAPFTLILVLLLLLTPVKEEPLNWDRVVNLAITCRDFFVEQISKLQQAGREGEFSLAMVGFNNEDRNRFFGRIVEQPSTVLLRVENPASQRGDGYLNGVIRDTYTGSGFVKSEEDLGEKDEYNMNYYEILYNLYYSQVKNESKDLALRTARYQIEYDGLATTSVFYPTNTSSVSLNFPSEINQNSHLNFEFNNKETGRLYSAYALLFNATNENYLSFIRQAGEVEYPRTENPFDVAENSIFAECFSSDSQENRAIEYITSAEFGEYLANRVTAIERIDLQLPDTLPNRVKELAVELTQDEETPYDKVKALEEYLEQFEYSLQVENIDENTDLVDSFLFEQQKGYCVQFASAMTVLSRSIGIPARYIEGFSMDYREAEQGKYLVKGNRAHAWCEVYLQGYGWLRIDATPDFGQTPFNIEWSKNPETEATESTYSQRPDFTETEDEPSEMQELEEPKNHPRTWIYIFIILGVLGIMTALFVIVRGKHMEHIYAKADTEEKILLSMQRMLLYLKMLHKGIERNETLMEYRNRLGETKLTKAFTICEQARYSTHVARMEDLEIVEAVARELAGQCREKYGKIRFELYKSISSI